MIVIKPLTFSLNDKSHKTTRSVCILTNKIAILQGQFLNIIDFVVILLVLDRKVYKMNFQGGDTPRVKYYYFF